jgi:hypothetical protein
VNFTFWKHAIFNIPFIFISNFFCLMNKTSRLLVLLLFTSGVVNAQFYYKDLVVNKQLIDEISLYKSNKVRNIRIKSFEDDGYPSEGFFCQKKISKDYRRVELFTRASVASPSLLVSTFNTDGTLASTNDSSEISVKTTSYNYDQKKRITSILSIMRSSDDDFTNEITEEHLYEYNENDQPVKMYKVKGRRDTTVILFANDEKGNVGIEKDTRSGTKYYYYYDNNNRLTDVVQQNDFKTQLLPDYLFEYDNAGRITQMTSVEEGSNNYYVWKYSYSNGLRSKERIFTKERRLMGTIEYEYD